MSDATGFARRSAALVAALAVVVIGASCSTPQAGTIATVDSPYHISVPGGSDEPSGDTGWWEDSTVVCMPLGGHLTVTVDEVPYHYDPDSAEDRVAVQVLGGGYNWGTSPTISLVTGEQFTTPNQYIAGTCVTVITTTGYACGTFDNCFYPGFRATVTWPTL